MDKTKTIEAIRSFCKSDTAAKLLCDAIAEGVIDGVTTKPGILQELYNSEINARLSTFWDAGFYAQLGDCLNGYCGTVKKWTFLPWRRPASI